MDLLEIPELLENCVRGEMFEEALDLKNHVEVIVERHRNLPLLNMILKDMQIAIGKMSDALLQELQAKKIPLTELLKVISYLRRMNLFSEQELRKQFLIRRERWFQNETDKLLLDFQTSKNGYAYLTQLVDFNRLNLFEIITQFRALFVEGADETDQVKAGEGNILHLWVRYRIAELLNALSW